MNFNERLKELRTNKEFLQKDIAKLLNVRNTTISAWELGENEPDILTIKKLATLFDVSTDYLLGLENEDGSKNTNFKKDEFHYNDGVHTISHKRSK